MKDKAVTWDDETLDKFLKRPRSYIKGNRMTFVGVRKEQERLDLIAFIKEHS